MDQRLTHRLYSVRGALFLTVLSILSLWIALFMIRRQLATSFALKLATVDGFSQIIQAPEQVLLLSRMAAAHDPVALFKAWGLGGLVACTSLISGVLLLWFMLRRDEVRTGHGSSTLASRQDIVNAGLLDNEHTGTSLIIGGWVEPGQPASDVVEYLVYSAPESLTAFAPSGSAKTVALVIPNLLCYESSAFVLDVKRELWDSTAGYRQQELGQKVLFHDPSTNDGKGACYNALEEVNIEQETAVRDVQMIAEYLIPQSTRKSEDSDNTDHFKSSARSLMVGIVLLEISKAHLAQKPAASIPSVLSCISNPECPFKDYLKEMVVYNQGDARIATVIRETAREMLEKEDREFSGVYSSLITPLSKFRDPILAAATSHSDFKIMDLVDTECGMTLYLTIRPSERDRLKSYFGMIINLLFRKLTDDMSSNGQQRREVLMMLEEFTSMPPLPVVQDSMDVMRGYGLKAFIILQDVQSLNALYGDNETFTSNSKVQIAYTPSKPKTAQLLSDMVGETTITERTDSSSSKTLSPIPSSLSQGEAVHARNLLTADEITRMSIPKLDANNKLVEAGSALIFMRGCLPIMGVQTPYFFDPELKRRASLKAPDVSDRIARVEESTLTPSQQEYDGVDPKGEQVRAAHA